MATEKRLIDANKVEFALAAICNRESGIPLAVAEWLANVVRNAPTVDAVEVVHGKAVRIRSDIDYEDTIIRMDRQCDKCGALITQMDNYCPNCGAKMDGDGNG